MSGMPSRILSLILFGFFHQHDRDTIADRISFFTLGTPEVLGFLAVLEISLAHGTGQYFQELFTERHNMSSFIYRQIVS